MINGNTLYRKTTYIVFFILYVAMLTCLWGCSEKHEAYVSASTVIRDNTPVCLVPTADGTTVYANDYAGIDASHCNEGYLMVRYQGQSKKVKLQIIGPDYMTYTYDLTKTDYEVFPLSAGNGIYQIGIYENVEGSQYATVFSQEIELQLANSMGPFLYPNQYVTFDSDSNVVSKGA